MNQSRFPFSNLIIVFLCIFLLFSICFAEVDFGVRVGVGDWMEYNVSYEGLPELGANFFGYEIIEVNNSVLTIMGTTNYSNGTIETENYIVDIFRNSFTDFDGFIIPGPIGEELSFFSGDVNLGYFNISSLEIKDYSGAQRDVVIVNLSKGESSNKYIYDKSFGILVEYQQFESEYSLSVKLTKTNLWSSTILGLEPTQFSLFIILIGFLIILFVYFLIRKRKI